MTEHARRECGVCWWVYDPTLGDDDAQVPPGVAFDDLADGYTCPRCQAPKERFLRPTQDAVGRLVSAYRAIERGMRGLPIHNPRLAVEAVGFRPVGDVLVGALVTPWFLNIVVFGRPLPAEGQSVDLSFPGGRFSAMGASPEGASHLAIALLSPVNELADQAAARAVAEESLRLVLTPETAAAEARPSAAAGPAAVGRRALLRGLVGG
ncbi:MAG TPA: [NiFe]-hydrogenase assembly chaperone HybE [Labilithrix sp.]|nr:[NiFe]-hydrogenase assembly chaperone HybE [Labilithrix sp.]